MFGKKKSQQQKKPIQLPHQPGPPSVRQLQKMLDETLHGTGFSVQMPFGESPEMFTITVSRDPMRGIVHWMLYRGEGSQSFLEWDQVTSDPNWVFNLIEAAFPQMSKRKTLTEVPIEQVQTAKLTALEVDDTKSKPDFEGDVQNMAIPNLIQSIDMNALTGRLEIDAKTQSGVVYFIEGKPIHCIVDGGEGEPALLELIAWTHGKFKFFKEEARQQKTINRPLHHLLMAGAALQDQMNLLRDKGVGLDTYLIRKHSQLSPEDFNKMVAEGTGCDEAQQRQFYDSIDGRTPIVDMLRQMPMGKTTWVPIVFNMVTCGLCSFKNGADFNETKPVAVNWNEVHQVSSLLSQPDTAIYTKQAYLYFLAMEYYRFVRFKHPFSTLIINAGLKAADERIYPLHADAFRLVGHHIKQVVRETDLLFHFGESSLACILPSTNLPSAKQFAQHLMEILNSTPLVTASGTYAVAATVGAASIPESCESVESMITLAQPRAFNT
jgi:diguanylate cyclase (GGDEF)-like protein